MSSFCGSGFLLCNFFFEFKVGFGGWGVGREDSNSKAQVINIEVYKAWTFCTSVLQNKNPKAHCLLAANYNLPTPPTIFMGCHYPGPPPSGL